MMIMITLKKLGLFIIRLKLVANRKPREGYGEASYWLKELSRQTDAFRLDMILTNMVLRSFDA